jgi:hypothetical protein
MRIDLEGCANASFCEHAGVSENSLLRNIKCLLWISDNGCMNIKIKSESAPR